MELNCMDTKILAVDALYLKYLNDNITNSCLTSLFYYYYLILKYNHG